MKTWQAISLSLAMAGIMWGGALATAVAAPPAVSLTSIQPVDAPSDPDTKYDSTSSLFVYTEPTAYPELPGSGYRANVDFQIRNDEPDYIRLDTYESDIGQWNASLSGQQLLAMPEELLDFPLGPAELRRPVLLNGGFGVTGFKLELYVTDEGPSQMTFGEALDVLPYDLDNGSGYLVSGSYQYLIGDPPIDSEDPPPAVGEQGFIAKYSTNGTLRKKYFSSHEAISAMADLKDGRYVIAGRHVAFTDEPGTLMVQRVNSWALDDMGKSTDLDYIIPDKTFGDDPDADWTDINFSDGGKPCDVGRVADVIVVDKANYLVLATELSCTTGDRIGLAVLTSDGDLVSSFGDGGTKILDGTKGADAVPVGISRTKARLHAIGTTAAKNHWIWLGAALGNECKSFGEQCSFGLTRFDYLTGKLHPSGWYSPAEPSFAIGNQKVAFDGARPHDMELDTSGRPVMAGGIRRKNGDRFVAVHRFSSDGTSDTTFGIQGWSVQTFEGHEGEAYAVQPRSNGQIALAVLSTESSASGETGSMAMMDLSSLGTLMWQHSPYSAGDAFTHTSIRTKLNYGYRYEDQVASFPWALAEDNRQRLIMVGFGLSEFLDNPCAAEAKELDDPLLDFGNACGGPRTVALARYLPFGEPDSRRWMAPNETRNMIVPSDQHLGTSSPAVMILHLGFNGFSPLSIVHDMTGFQNAVFDAQTDSFGSYRFPFASSVLANDERFLVNAHPLDHHHRNSSGNRFAYDISMVRWDGSHWVKDDPSVAGGGNAAKLVFEKPVRAVADGKVVACRRSAPDNPLGQIDSPDANFVRIQHSFDPFDATKQEYITYMHFRQNSVPESVCPNICPAESPNCDVEVEGVDPDGATLPEPIDVEAGQLIGLVGNSGTSTEPHLHVHLTTGQPETGSYPLLFHDVLIQSMDSGPDGQTFDVNGQEIRHGSLAIPTE